MMNIFLAFQFAYSVEQSFSHLKMIQTRLRSHLLDCSVAQLMRISIEGPEINAVEFEEILEIFLKNIIIDYYFDCVVYLVSYCCKLMC